MSDERPEPGGLVPDPPRDWPLRAREPGPDLVICKARWDVLENPRTGREMRRLVLETPDWVNVVALTPEGELVVIQQYRFGPGEVTLEIPGGVIDPGEEHADAARRELREETGYTSERWSYLGWVQPNPAFHTNVCHHWLALDARRTTRADPDPGEDIVVGTLPTDRVAREVHAGRMRHSLVVSALSRVLDLRLDGAADRPRLSSAEPD